MKSLVTVTAEEAKGHFLKGSSYFNCDLPSYISFDSILTAVAGVLGEDGYAGCERHHPADLSGVNYRFDANKDGRMAWRPYELIHPAIYTSLVELICKEENWSLISQRFIEFGTGVVECCSLPVISESVQSDQATQGTKWWQAVEQSSIVYSMEFSHVLHTDVTNCYGSLYTHSISWALHGLEVAKESRRQKDLLGNEIDNHIRAGRYGQTNGIPQGSALMDLLAEIVLGYVDHEISSSLGGARDFRILRYRDDYRVFANSDQRAEEILKVISDKLRDVGMALGPAKTFMSTNVVGGSVKEDKMAGIDLQDLGIANAKTIQKRLLRLHAFGCRFPNSGSLKRLLSELHREMESEFGTPQDLEVQVAITTDISFVSPQTIPAVAGILSHLISRASVEQKKPLWDKVAKKMRRIPHNGYLEIWLQRVIRAQSVGGDFQSTEPICQIVNGHKPELWENAWIASRDLLAALDVSNILVGSVVESEEIVRSEEVKLFHRNAYAY